MSCPITTGRSGTFTTTKRTARASFWMAESPGRVGRRFCGKCEGIIDLTRAAESADFFRLSFDGATVESPPHFSRNVSAVSRVEDFQRFRPLRIGAAHLCVHRHAARPV